MAGDRGRLAGLEARPQGIVDRLGVFSEGDNGRVGATVATVVSDSRHAGRVKVVPVGTRAGHQHVAHVAGEGVHRLGLMPAGDDRAARCSEPRAGLNAHTSTGRRRAAFTMRRSADRSGPREGPDTTTRGNDPV